MKLNGKQLTIRETVKIKLPRYSGDIELLVSAIPMGLRKMFEEICPRPRPPFEMINKVGKTPEKIENYDDPAFVKEYNEWSFLQNIYTFWMVLGGDPNLQFDNVPTDIESLRKVEREIREAGISDGDMAFVLGKAAQASNISDRDLKDATENLL